MFGWLWDLTDFKKVKILDFLNFGQRCLGWFWLIEKLFVLAQIDVWMALGLSIVDLGQLITLEASPKNTSEKLGLGHACRLDPLRPPRDACDGFG